MNVKLLDLGLQYEEIKDESVKAILDICDRQSFILGRSVRLLEESVADYCGVRHAVGVASGTDAILLSLMAVGVGYGDIVITTPYTFFSTLSSIARLGATPLLVDIDSRTYNIDPLLLEERLAELSLDHKLMSRIKAVIPVHLFGQCADMKAVNSISCKYGLSVVEDAAQAIGAESHGRKAGSMGRTGCLSFYPSKNLGGFGDGGMVLTGNARIAEKLRMLRVHGSKTKYYHSYIGINSRLDEIQAAVLLVKLRRLDVWEEQRIRNAARYEDMFAGSGIEEVSPPYIEKFNRSVFNQYVIRVKKRDSLKSFLSRHNIGTDIYYPIPLHLQRCFRYLKHSRGDFPVSEKAAKETLALPIYPELTEDKQEYVVRKIREFYS